MILKTNARHGSTAVAPYRQSISANVDAPEVWGSWLNQKYISRLHISIVAYAILSTQILLLGSYTTAYTRKNVWLRR